MAGQQCGSNLEKIRGDFREADVGPDHFHRRRQARPFGRHSGRIDRRGIFRQVPRSEIERETLGSGEIVPFRVDEIQLEDAVDIGERPERQGDLEEDLHRRGPALEQHGRQRGVHVGDQDVDLVAGDCSGHGGNPLGGRVGGEAAYQNVGIGQRRQRLVVVLAPGIKDEAVRSGQVARQPAQNRMGAGADRIAEPGELRQVAEPQRRAAERPWHDRRQAAHRSLTNGGGERRHDVVGDAAHRLEVRRHVPVEKIQEIVEQAQRVEPDIRSRRGAPEQTFKSGDQRMAAGMPEPGVDRHDPLDHRQLALERPGLEQRIAQDVVDLRGQPVETHRLDLGVRNSADGFDSSR